MRNKDWGIERQECWFETLSLPPKLKAQLIREADGAWELACQQAEAEAVTRNAAAETSRVAGDAPNPMANGATGGPKLKGRGSRITLIEPELIRRLDARLTSVGLGDKQRKENLVKTVQHVAAHRSSSPRLATGT